MAIIIPIGVDTSGLRALNQAGGRLRSFGKIAAIAAGAAGIGAMVKTLQVGTAEFMEQQKVAAQTGAVLKSTGGIANVTAKQIGSLSTALMKKSGVDDEAIASGQNLLLTFTKIRNETGKGNDIFDQATVAMLDLSVAMGKDLNSSAILVGKALNDPVKGATALSRAGVQLTQGQKDQIEAFVESGRVLEAQKIILAELTTQFGGSAEAAGKTLPGQLNILKQTFNNLAGELAATFLPSLANAATKLTNFLNRFVSAPTLQAKVEVITGSVESAFTRLKDWWNTGQRKELPAGVVLSPPGREQVNTFIEDLATKLDAGLKKKGDQIGFALAEAIFGGAKRGAKQKGEDAGNSIVANLFVNVPGIKLGIKLGEYVIDGFERYLNQEGSERAVGILDRWAEYLAKGLGLGAIYELGREAASKFAEGADDGGRRPKSGANLKNILTKQVKDAIQAARQSLAGAGTALGGSLATILGATIKGPTGMTGGDILKRERELQDERMRLEEDRLKEAVNSAEATDEDRLALAEFYLNKEKTLRDRIIEDETAKRQSSIDNLVEQFNRGLVSAKQFETELNAIVGADKGTELGIAFAGAFQREIDSIIKIAKEIQTVVGGGVDKQPIAGQGVGLVGTLSAENERRFQEALDAWQKRFDARKKIAEDARKKDGVSAEERKEINEIMRDWQSKPGNKKPTRSQFGLTAMALGGILRQPTFVAGEAGKEAVIPLESGSAMRILRDAIGGGGGSTQVINLTVNAGLGTNPDELSQVIVNSIKRYEKRNGAVFQGPLVTTTANATGSTDPTTGATTFNKIRTLRSG